MQTLNALDAVTPALGRTRLVLLKPFRFGRTWKLCATAYLAFAATFFLPFPLMYLGFLPHILRSHNAAAATWLIGGVSLLMAILIALFYVCSRLEFAFFDIVLHRGTHVAPAWRKYGQQTWPWIAVKILLGVILTVVLAAPLSAYFHHIFAFVITMKPGQPQSPAVAFQILSAELGVFGIFSGLFLLGSLLTDFVLPSLALENTTLREAFKRFGRLIASEPGQVAGFVAMKVILGVVGYIALVAIFYVVLLIFLILAVIVGGLGYVLLHAMHVSGGVMIGLAVCFGLIGYFVLCFYCGVSMAGSLLTFLQSYALYFLGGRYPLVGEALHASTPVVYPAYAYPYAYPPPMVAVPVAIPVAASVASSEASSADTIPPEV